MVSIKIATNYFINLEGGQREEEIGSSTARHWPSPWIGDTPFPKLN
jgi:hypothetical protein